MVEVAGGKVWILQDADRDDVRELCVANYWSIVRLILEQYVPAIVEGSAAVRLHVEEYSPPELLTVRQKSNRSRYTVGICQGLSICSTPGSVIPQRVVTRRPMGIEIPVDPPEETLLRLTVGVLRKSLDEVAVWLRERSLGVSRPALEAAYAREPRPLVVKRLSHLAREVRNDRLADQLDALLASAYGHRIGRGQTGVGKKIIIPRYIITLPPARTVWLERHAGTYAHFREILSGLPAPSRMMKKQVFGWSYRMILRRVSPSFALLLGGPTMRGDDRQQQGMFSYLSPEAARPAGSSVAHDSDVGRRGAP